MKNYNKIVIFDWGGVVESHDEKEYNYLIAKIDTMNRLLKEKLDSNIILGKCAKCNANINGKSICEVNKEIDLQEWFNRMKSSFDLKCDYKEFYDVYQEEFDKVEYYKPVVEFAHSLKDKCQIGILSNLASLDKPRINKQYDLSKFDYVWLSFEMNCQKPDEEIYTKVENECKIKPENILFIDDVEDNLKVAIQKGWNVCLANGHELNKIKECVNKFLEE